MMVPQIPAEPDIGVAAPELLAAAVALVPLVEADEEAVVPAPVPLAFAGPE